MASVSRPTLRACGRNDVVDLSRALADPAWLRDRRLAAWDHWERTPLPSRSDETWRRTDLSRVDLESFEPMRDGEVELTPLPDELGRLGVVFCDLRTAVRQHEALLRDHLLATVTSADGKFQALNAAFLTGGAFLHVPAGVAVELPLHVVTRHATPGGAFFPHTLVVAGRGSQVTLVEEARGQGDDPGLAAAAIEVVASEGSRVNHAQISLYGRGLIHCLAHRARLARDAQYVDLVVALGGGITKASIETLLLAPGADSQVLGVAFGDGTQHFDHDTLQDHRAPHTTSRLLFKSALAGRARSVYTGLLRMRKTAQQAEASQVNRNLLLSEQARADSIPKLEIEVNDVRCSHAAASSSVDAEQIFYLMSRGLPREDAVRMVVEGFLGEVVAQFPLPALAEQVMAEISARLSRVAQR